MKRLLTLSLGICIFGYMHSAALDNSLEHTNDLFSKALYAEAMVGYQQLLTTDDLSKHERHIAQVNLAQCLIAQGVDSHNAALWHEAWPKFEERLSLEDRAPLHNPLKAGMCVQGKTVRVKAEYGFGDDVTFAPMFCSVLQKLGATVVLELPGIHRLLASLFKRTESISQVITQHTPTDEIPQCDHEVYLMSLPGMINANGYGATDAQSIPKITTAFADADLVAKYKADMPADKVHLAVCWRASKNAVAGGTRIIDRNLPISLLTQLAEDEGYVRLWSVQGPPDAFVTESEFSRMEHLAQTGNLDPYLDVIPDRHKQLITQVIDDKERPFENTAAAISACDAFAGCDTVFPNLAAAMGKKTFFLLKQEQVDMRWGTTGNTTPWFDTATLLRQERPDDWTKPLADLKAALPQICFNK